LKPITFAPYIKTFFFGLIGFCFFLACSPTDQRLQPYKNDLGIRPAVIAQIDTLHYTNIQWISPVKNIGPVKEGDSVFMKFWFKNTGRHPLFISSVKPACGCTLPSVPEEPVMPGEKGFLPVFFNTNNQEGDIHKTIIVTTNTSNGVRHVLSFSGNVSGKNQVK
jgi:hypothetical protein